jgi:hypothetical protein
LEKLVFIGNSPSEIEAFLNNIFLQKFDNQQIIKRKNLLESNILAQQTFLKEIFYKNNLF